MECDQMLHPKGKCNAEADFIWYRRFDIVPRDGGLPVDTVHFCSEHNKPGLAGNIWIITEAKDKDPGFDITLEDP